MRDIEILMTARMHDRVIEVLDEHFTLHRLWEQPDRAAYLEEVGPRIRGVATTYAYGRTGGKLYDLLPNAKIVSSFGVGYEHVDAAEAARRGIVVTNTPDVLTEEVADLSLGLILATLRQLPQGDRFVRAGRWPEEAFPLSPSLRRRTAGILGLGRIGKAIARRIEACGVPVHYHGRKPQTGATYTYHPTPVALAEAVDLLVVATTGGSATKHLVNAEVLEALGPDGVLINISRGSVVDEKALIEALATKTILTAGLDVFEDEPHVPQELMDMEHVVLLPHLGSASVLTRNAMAQLTADNLISWFSGKGPITPVDETPWPGPSAVTKNA
jgi:lactate dehydrogenase-like 2-hydroxyacid dehydrogenase